MSTASEKGEKFERLVADYLSQALGDDRIDRRTKRGVNDRGDIAGVRLHGQKVVIECKAKKEMRLGDWLEEAEVERGNDDAEYGVVVAKRQRRGKARDQYCVMTLETFAAILAGGRDYMLEASDE